MDDLAFGDDEPQLSQTKRKASIPKTALKTAQKPARSGKQETKKKKNEQAQKKRREKKTSTKTTKDEGVPTLKKTDEKKTLDMAEALLSELLDLSTRVDVKPLEHKPGKPIRPLDELSCFKSCYLALIFLYQVDCLYRFLIVLENQVLAVTAAG